MITVNQRFEEKFHALFAVEGIDPSLLNSVTVHDEVPVYSRYSQLEFLEGLGFSEINRQLIRASVSFLERALRGHDTAAHDRSGDRLLCMVSVTDWHVLDERGTSVCNDGSIDYIVPHVWTANLRDSSMANFDITASDYPPGLREPNSAPAEFVAAALENSPEYAIYQSPEYDWCPERVYIRCRA